MTSIKRGFAAMSPEAHRKIASMGGKAVPAAKRSFSTNRDLATVAGQKGGAAVQPHRRSFYYNRALARAAGQKGGRAVSPERRTFSDPEVAKEAALKSVANRKKS